MGLTASTMCCPHSHHPAENDKKDKADVDSTKDRAQSKNLPCCPASPLASVKPEPLLSRVHLLAGCTSIPEHNHKIRHALQAAEKLHGHEGLRAMGFGYKRFYCIEHQTLEPDKGSNPSLGDLSTPLALNDEIATEATSSIMEDNGHEKSNISSLPAEIPGPDPPLQTAFTIASSSPTDPSPADSDVASQTISSQGADDGKDGGDDGDEDKHNALTETMAYSIRLRTGDSDVKDEIRSTSSVIGTGDHLTVVESIFDEFTQVESIKYCLNCRRRLQHLKTGSIIGDDNRLDFIADGIMYDRVAVLCQEVALDAMCEDYDLEWRDVAPASHNGERAEIRALVSKPLPPDAKNGTTGTIFIVTGRGAVRAGIFSRQALVAGQGLETGCAWHLLREASLRRMNVIIPDPNCRGDRWGYDVVRQTLRALWPHDAAEDVYMIIHSAGGSNVQRFLLDTPDTAKTHLPQIQAMALTDSTHNLQWCKTEPEWKAFWESERIIYLKSAQLLRDADGSRWYLHAAGTPIQTDSFWKHRFGNVLTCNAGTNIHSMTNWYGHQPIWKHLDTLWKRRQQEKQGQQDA